MVVDDVLAAEGELPVGVDEIPLGLNSNLYFGGTRILINDMAASDIYLDGCISDIIANGRWVPGEDAGGDSVAVLSERHQGVPARRELSGFASSRE